MLILGIVVAVLCYGFIGTTTGMVLNKKLDEAVNWDTSDCRIWAVIFGLMWPAVWPAMSVWSLSTKTVKSLETRKQNKLLPEATVESE